MKQNLTKKKHWKKKNILNTYNIKSSVKVK